MLESTLTSQPLGDSLAFELRVDNHGEESVDLSFSDAQRVRVSVFPAGVDDTVDPVWRSDADRMFAQVDGTETVPPEGSITFDAAWEAPMSGEYRAVAAVTCREAELRDETTVLV